MCHSFVQMIQSSDLLCATVYQEEGTKFVFRETTTEVSDNYMDRWILSFTQSLIKFVTKEMAGECCLCCAGLTEVCLLLYVCVSVCVCVCVCV